MDENILNPPINLTEEEKIVWDEFVTMLNSSTNYKKIMTDKELVLQYVQLKIIRDKAWISWIQNPERYVRIVTGICSDGKTPKIMVKENEHYKTYMESNFGVKLDEVEFSESESDHDSSGMEC